MVILSLIITICLNVAFAQVTGENKFLSQKANSSDQILIINSIEYFHYNQDYIYPINHRQFYSEPGSKYFLFGRDYPVFNEDHSRNMAMIGNEVGDPLFQEVVQDKQSSNHNPMLKGSFKIPMGETNYIYGAFHQVDHFGIWNLSDRSNILKGKISKSNFESKTSWFGENIPSYSLLSFGTKFHIDKSSWVDLDYDKGWMWTYFDEGGYSIPFGVDRFSAKLDYHGYNVLYSFTSLKDLSENDYGSDLFIQSGLIKKQISIDNKIITLGSSFDFRETPKNYKIQYADKYLILPFVSFNISLDNNVSLRGFNSIGENFFTIQDTVGIKFISEKQKFISDVAIYTSNKINPFLDYSLTNDIGASNLNFKNNFLNISFINRIVFGDKNGNIEFKINPWLLTDVPYFKHDSLAMIGVSTQRTGHYESINDNVYGIKTAIKVHKNVINKLKVRSSIGIDSYFGHGASKLDLIPPSMTALVGVAYIFPSGLNVIGNYIYRSSYMLNNWNEDGVDYNGSLESNIEVRQSFFNGKWQLWMSALNIIGEDRREHINGNFNRFRMLVGTEYFY